MKTLLFGANGQIGWELRRSLLPLGKLDLNGLRLWQADVSGSCGMESSFRWSNEYV